MDEIQRHVWDMEEVLDELRKSAGAVCNIKRKPRDEPIPYDGPLLTAKRVAYTGLNVDQAFTVKNLAYDAERGRDALWIVLSAAFRLGIEQGFRMMMDESLSLEFKQIETALKHKNPATEAVFKEIAQEALDAIRERVENPGQMP